MGFKLFQFYVKNEINSRWKFSCSPVFLDFLWTAPHHYSNAVSLSFQPLSSWINICASSKYSGLNLFFFLLFLGSGRYSQNPEGHLGNAAIWKITAPLRHALCALLKSVVIILGGAWRTGERAPNYTRALFKCGGCCLQPNVPLTYLQLLADTPQPHNLSAEEMTGGQEVSTSQGLFPAWWSYTHGKNTLTNGSPWRSKLRSLCLCRCLAAKTTTPLRGFRTPLWLTDNLVSLRALRSLSSFTLSLSQVDGGTAGLASRW